jgi:hypothetical protein
MPAVPEAGPTSGAEILKRAGLEPLVRHLGAIGQAVDEAHRALRSEERAAVLDTPLGRGAGSLAERGIEDAKAHAKQARQVLKAQRKSETWKTLKKDADSKKGDVKKSLAKARTYWIDAIHGADYTAEDAAEIASVWDTTVDAWSKRGIDGLFDQLDGKFAAADTALTREEDFGRGPHSPLATWQWIVIGVIVGIAVAAVIACLIWAGCVWIKEIFIATCWGTGAVGGWSGICAIFTF